jgi:hypothetical protein
MKLLSIALKNGAVKDKVAVMVKVKVKVSDMLTKTVKLLP